MSTDKPKTQQDVFNAHPLYKCCERCRHWGGKKPIENGQIVQGQCALNGWDISSTGHCAAWELEEHWRECRYVRHREIALYLSLGWVIVDDMQDTHHGLHAVLMEKKR